MPISEASMGFPMVLRDARSYQTGGGSFAKVPNLASYGQVWIRANKASFVVTLYAIFASPDVPRWAALGLPYPGPIASPSGPLVDDETQHCIIGGHRWGTKNSFIFLVFPADVWLAHPR